MKLLTVNNFSYIEISQPALFHNLQQFRKFVGKSLLMAVVKSNAYGHGINLVARVIEKKVDWFGVVNFDEALCLRKQKIKKPILVLSYFSFSQIFQAIKQNISLVVYTKDQIKYINSVAKKLNKKALVHLKIDSGTNRLGIPPAEVENFIETIKKNKFVFLQGIFSHFAASEENARYTKAQLNIFKTTAAKSEKIIGRKLIKHIACSAATLLNKNNQLDLVRMGLALYGLYPSPQTAKIMKKTGLSFKPVLSLKTQVIQVKNVPKGAFVGYGCAYKALVAQKIAVLPVGYFEGYLRALSNKSCVLIKGVRCPVRGRVCMNLMMVDVTGVETIKIGDEAALIGKQGRGEITVDELAELSKTINYEVVARLNPLIKRILV